MQTNRWSIQDLTRMALLAALMCASAYIAFPIPITLVNVTAQTFVLHLVALLLTKEQAGVTELAGPTGGFIVGFLIAAWLIAWLKGDNPSPSRALVLTLIGIPIIDLLGAAWYAVYAQIPLTTALLTTALPFLPGDIIKAIGAVLVYLPLRKALRQFSK